LEVDDDVSPWDAPELTPSPEELEGEAIDDDDTSAAEEDRVALLEPGGLLEGGREVVLAPGTELLLTRVAPLEGPGLEEDSAALEEPAWLEEPPEDELEEPAWLEEPPEDELEDDPSPGSHAPTAARRTT
jgi:hypothetical protein